MNEADDAIRSENYRRYFDSIERRIEHLLIERSACLLGHYWLCCRSLDEARSELREGFASFRALEPSLASLLTRKPEAGEQTPPQNKGRPPDAR